MHIDGTNIEEKTLLLLTSVYDQDFVIVMFPLKTRTRSSCSCQPVARCRCVDVAGPDPGGASRPGDRHFCTADLGQTKWQLPTWFAVPVMLCARAHAPGWVQALVIILFSLTADLYGSRMGIRLPLSACCVTPNDVMCKDGRTERSFAAGCISTLSSRSVSECNSSTTATNARRQK